MSPQGSQPRGSSEPDIYVGLLFVSVAAMIAGIIFLVMELTNYNFEFPA